MLTKKVSSGTVHTLPSDILGVLSTDTKVRAAWEDITPLARNEWICWITTVKKPETRTLHLERMRKELVGGKRRPCCWAGCIHRNNN